MKRNLIVVMVAALALAACGKKDVSPEAPVVKAMESGRPAATSGANVDAGSATAMDPFEDPANPLSTRVIFFEYDSTEVKDVDSVNAHAQYLADNPGARVRLEGHADERGTREYNVALGEQRSLAVKRLMAFQRVQPDQITVVGFGEERPVAFGHSEKSWQQNRRVEIVYEAK